MCSLSKEQSILSMHFFNRMMPLFQLRLFIPYQAPHSRVLAPKCSAFAHLYAAENITGKRETACCVDM